MNVSHAIMGMSSYYDAHRDTSCHSPKAVGRKCDNYVHPSSGIRHGIFLTGLKQENEEGLSQLSQPNPSYVSGISQELSHGSVNLQCSMSAPAILPVVPKWIRMNLP